MHHYFVENKNIEKQDSLEFEVFLSSDDIAHMHAQRLRVGEHVSIVDKASNYYEVEIVSISSSGFVAKIARRVDFYDSPASISLYYCLSKATKTEEVLRAATEIGIDDFYPIISQRSVVKLDVKKSSAKVDRYKRIARSASMQAGRRDIPHVHQVCALGDLDDAFSNLDILVVFWEKADPSDTIYEIFDDNITRVGVLIGPEGGLDESEIDHLTRNFNALVCTMGSTILRTETAGCVACALVKHELSRTKS